MHGSASIAFDKFAAASLDAGAYEDYANSRFQAVKNSIVVGMPLREDAEVASSSDSVPVMGGGTLQAQLAPIDHTPPPWREEKSRLDTFVSLQTWEGVVDSIENDDIRVRLFDALDPSTPELITSFSKLELDDEDLRLAEPGAVFYWSVGYAQSASGRRRQSMIRFRRLPMWTDRDIARGKDRGSKLYEKFGNKQDDRTKKL